MREITYRVNGVTPLLIHADDIDAADNLERWRKDIANRKSTKPGDDRFPPWTWVGYCYHNGSHLTVAAEQVLKCLSAAGSKVIMQKRTTAKRLCYTSLQVPPKYLQGFELVVKGGKRVSLHELPPLTATFAENEEIVKKLGFRLFKKRARVGTSKHVRVRPCFDSWSFEFVANVLDPDLDLSVVDQVFTIAGQQIGLGDWRPGGDTPGLYGQFEAKRVK